MSLKGPTPSFSTRADLLSRISRSHDVQKHGAIIPGCSRHDGWGRPRAPWTASAAVQEKENAAPPPPHVHSLHSFLMEMTTPCTNTHIHTVRWERVKASVHKGEGWPVRTLSAKLWAPIHHWERLLMRKPGAPGQKFSLFSLPFSRQDAQSY